MRTSNGQRDTFVFSFRKTYGQIYFRGVVVNCKYFLFHFHVCFHFEIRRVDLVFADDVMIYVSIVCVYTIVVFICVIDLALNGKSNKCLVRVEIKTIYLQSFKKSRIFYVHSPQDRSPHYLHTYLNCVTTQKKITLADFFWPTFFVLEYLNNFNQHN